MQTSNRPGSVAEAPGLLPSFGIWRSKTVWFWEKAANQRCEKHAKALKYPKVIKSHQNTMFQRPVHLDFYKFGMTWISLRFWFLNTRIKTCRMPLNFEEAGGGGSSCTQLKRGRSTLVAKMAVLVAGKLLAAGDVLLASAPKPSQNQMFSKLRIPSPSYALALLFLVFLFRVFWCCSMLLYWSLVFSFKTNWGSRVPLQGSSSTQRSRTLRCQTCHQFASHNALSICQGCCRCRNMSI